jgi:hypothetical protein
MALILRLIWNIKLLILYVFNIQSQYDLALPNFIENILPFIFQELIKSVLRL